MRSVLAVGFAVSNIQGSCAMRLYFPPKQADSKCFWHGELCVMFVLGFILQSVQRRSHEHSICRYVFYHLLCFAASTGDHTMAMTSKSRPDDQYIINKSLCSARRQIASTQTRSP